LENDLDENKKSFSKLKSELSIQQELINQLLSEHQLVSVSLDKKKQEFQCLVKETKEKLSKNGEDYLEDLLEAQIEVSKNSNPFAYKQLAKAQERLGQVLSEKEINTLLNKQEEIIKLLENQQELEAQKFYSQSFEVEEFRGLQKKLEEIANIVLPDTIFDFVTLKTEIERLKTESLSHQIQVRNIELDKLLNEAKRKVGEENYFLLETLLEIQKDIVKLGNDSFIKRLKDLENLLHKRKLSDKDIEKICQKQKEITQLEEVAKLLDISQEHQTQILVSIVK